MWCVAWVTCLVCVIFYFPGRYQIDQRLLVSYPKDRVFVNERAVVKIKPSTFQFSIQSFTAVVLQHPVATMCKSLLFPKILLCVRLSHNECVVKKYM